MGGNVGQGGVQRFTSGRLGLVLGVCLVLIAPAAKAFCGFYVAGADAQLFNNATMVVMMREGTTTVLSMQNNYQGPAEDFAMVVPVPVVLEEENVKTLPRDVFDRVDRLAAPRLVEYWEQDPCAPPVPKSLPMAAAGGLRSMRAPTKRGNAELGVTVEAEFSVGEYDVVVLSAQDSTGLDTWLRQEKYSIPEGAGEVLRPYVAQGMKFFVAKVDSSKVTFKDGQAMLSPLRFHFDAKTFFLPVRLGLLNSRGTQDLIVHILARGQRYEVANYDNVTIPTNLDVKTPTKDEFGAFYTALFDETLSRHPRAVITEYAWASSSCDPCPTPPLSAADIMTLGGDVLSGAQSGGPSAGAPRRRLGFAPGGDGFVLTRLHTRYSKHALGEDLVFRAAPPIAGGREFSASGGTLEEGAIHSGVNNFQGRYAVRHEWTGPVECAAPRRGIWGGPPGGVKPEPRAASNSAFAPRGKPLARFVSDTTLSSLKAMVSAGAPLGSAVPGLDLVVPPGAAGVATTLDPTTPATEPPPPEAAHETTAPPATAPAARGCGACKLTHGASESRGNGWAGLGLLLAALGLRSRRRMPGTG